MRTERYVTSENIKKKTEYWLTEIHAVAKDRPHIKPHRNTTALVVVDMINYFVHPDAKAYLPATEAILPTIRLLVETARSLEMPVIYTQHCNTPQNAGAMGRFFGSWIECGSESQITDRLEVTPADTVIRKHTYDAFFETSLQGILERSGIRQLIVSGVMTHLCCETTARSAFVRGFDVLVPVDSVAANLENLHLSALKTMAAGVARVTDSMELIDELTT